MKIRGVLRHRIPFFGFSVEAMLAAFIGMLLALALYKWVGIPLLAPYGPGVVKGAGIVVGISCIVYGIVIVSGWDRQKKDIDESSSG